MLQSILLSFLMKCGIWPLRWSNGKPMILTEFHQRRDCEFHQEAWLWQVSPTVWHILSLLLIWTSPLAVITVVGFLCPHGHQLSRIKVSLTDHMHTRSSLLLTQQWVRIPPRESRMLPCLLLWACKCFGQDSKPCFGHIAAVFQSLHGTCPLAFHSVMRKLWNFSPTMVLCFPRYLLDAA